MDTDHDCSDQGHDQDGQQGHQQSHQQAGNMQRVEDLPPNRHAGNNPKTPRKVSDIQVSEIPGRCNARTRRGGYCPIYPMHGKKRCYRHGGASNGRPPGPATVARRGLLERAKARESDASLFDLKPILAQLTTVAETVLEQLDKAKDDEPSTPMLELAASLLDKCAKTIERHERIRNASALTRAEVLYFQSRSAEIISKWLPDPDARAGFLRELGDMTQGSQVRPVAAPPLALPAPQRDTKPD